MKILECLQDLHQDVLFVPVIQETLHHQPAQVMIVVVEDQADTIFGSHDILDFDDVHMVQQLQKLNFTDCCYGELQKYCMGLYGIL